MASSIDNAFITQYGRRKPKMPQKRTRPPKGRITDKSRKLSEKLAKDVGRVTDMSLQMAKDAMPKGRMTNKQKKLKENYKKKIDQRRKEGDEMKAQMLERGMKKDLRLQGTFPLEVKPKTIIKKYLKKHKK